MLSYFWRNLKNILLKSCVSIAKKAALIILLGLIAFYFATEVKLWVKNETEKLLKDSLSTGINKIYPSPKKIKEKINSEIIEKDMVILNSELERLRRDFTEKKLKIAYKRLKDLEDKKPTINKQWLKDIENNYIKIKNKIYKDDAN